MILRLSLNIMEKKIFSAFLQKRGQRLTKERLVVLQKACACNGHFDPESLYMEIRATGLKTSRASVYRTLNLLYESGLIEKALKTDHGTLYEKSLGHGHHDHMMCIQCGRIFEFYSEELEKLQESLCSKQGFEGKSHSLEIKGYCQRCRKKKKP